MIEITTAPAQRPIELDLVKEHLRILESDDDNLLQHYIDAATDIFESLTKQALINRVVKQTFDKFPRERYFLLETGPAATTITSIKYWDELSVLRTVASSVYELAAGMPGVVSLKLGQSWPTDLNQDRHKCVEVVYTAGRGTSEADIPADIKQALSSIVGDLYVNREDTVIQPGATILNVGWHSKALMHKYRLNHYEHPSQQKGSVHGS